MKHKSKASFLTLLILAFLSLLGSSCGNRDNKDNIYTLAIITAATSNRGSVETSATYSWGTFTDYNDGTISLAITEGTYGGQAYTAQTLTWMKCSHGQTYIGGHCIGIPAATAYCSANDSSCDNGTVLNGTGISSAYTACNGLNSGSGALGKTNWRVSTINELKLLINCTDKTIPADQYYFGRENFVSPAINNLFPNTQSDIYWSSSTYASSMYLAYTVNFYQGDVTGYTKSNSFNYIRCIFGP